MRLLLGRAMIDVVPGIRCPDACPGRRRHVHIQQCMVVPALIPTQEVGIHEAQEALGMEKIDPAVRMPILIATEAHGRRLPTVDLPHDIHLLCIDRHHGSRGAGREPERVDAREQVAPQRHHATVAGTLAVCDSRGHGSASPGAPTRRSRDQQRAERCGQPPAVDSLSCRHPQGHAPYQGHLAVSNGARRPLGDRRLRTRAMRPELLQALDLTSCMDEVPTHEVASAPYESGRRRFAPTYTSAAISAATNAPQP